MNRNEERVCRLSIRKYGFNPYNTSAEYMLHERMSVQAADPLEHTQPLPMIPHGAGAGAHSGRSVRAVPSGVPGQAIRDFEAGRLN
jgi:hypothetical protein